MSQEYTPVEPGFIYILRNSSLKENLVKIGLTRRTSEIRAAELSRHTGVAQAFDVLYEEMVCNCELAEKLVHQRLEKFRINEQREFFDVPSKIAVRAVFETCMEVNGKFRHESSRLAIWIRPDSQFLHDVMAWLPDAPRGPTSVHFIVENTRARAEMCFSNALRIQCTPEVLHELKAKAWVKFLSYVTNPA